MGTRPVVLVHGAWHGAWCFDPLVAALDRRRVPVTCVELPGHGEDGGELTDLHGDADAVRHHLDRCAKPVVLVGHSYGGVVITEAGVHPQVAELVYIAAFNPDVGESAMDLAAAVSAAAALDHEGRPDALSAIRLGEDGVSTVDPAQARALFYNDCPDELADWAVARLGGQRIATLSDTPDAVAWRHRRSTYAVCTLDGIVHPAMQRVLARRADAVVEWPTGHSPFLSRPDLVAGLLADRAAGGSDPPVTGPAADATDVAPAPQNTQ
ncbi:MAG: alpha/beta hydrolase [Acidimicrobiales bacterium]